MKKRSTKEMAVEEWGGEPRRVEILAAFGIEETGREYLAFTEDEKPDASGHYNVEVVRINTSSWPAMSEEIEDEKERDRVFYELDRMIRYKGDGLPDGLYLVSLPDMIKPGAMPS